MQAPKSLRRPTNWQDFETLCKKLWGEIWNCPEIKRNGRSGQGQNGVDIYGVPKGEDGYYGIQCKGKDEYTYVQFSEEEITIEIEKAKNFQPSLKKLYFATTAIKDVKIESFVRGKHIQNLKANLFEIHIFSWEDIVELIDENQATHDWYLKNEQFKLFKDIHLTFNNDETTLQTKAKFLQPILSRVSGMRAKEFGENHSLFDYYDLGTINNMVMRNRHLFRNLSFFPIMIKVMNIATSPLEDYRIILNFTNEVQEISDTNQSGGLELSVPLNFYFDSAKKQVKIIPENPVLVGGDTFCSDKIFIKPGHNTSTITVMWSFLSRDFRREGTLTINAHVSVDKVIKEINVANSQSLPGNYGPIEDCIVPL